MQDAPTHFGSVSFDIVSEVNRGSINAKVTLTSGNTMKEICLHLRHPNTAPMKGVTINGDPWPEFNQDMETITLKDLAGTVTVTARF